MTTYDVIIIGGGIVGVSTASVLAQRQKNVLLLEQFVPAHQRGSSHGDGRMIRYAYGANEAVYLEMVKRSFAAWEQLSNLSATRLIQNTGLLNFGPPHSVHLNELKIAFNESNIPYEEMTVADCASRFPQFRLDSRTEIVYEPSGGTIFADKAVMALWQLAQAEGATLRTDERVIEIQADSETIVLRTEPGNEYTGKRLVIAVGGWASSLLQQVGVTLDLEVTQEQIGYFRPNGAFDHSVGVMPNCLDYHHHQPFYSLAEIDGHGVKVGWHHTGKRINADYPLPIDEDNLTAIQDFVRQRFPYLDPNPIKVQPCLYTNTPDYHFVIDRHPTISNIVLAVGFSGHGFKFGTVLGEMIAALLMDTAPPVPLDQFSLNRFDHPEAFKRRITA
jgi:monomeric sarcosine oxidase